MIFNKENNGAQEIATITGNYYATNDFSRIVADVEDATAQVCDIITEEVYNSIEAKYMNDEDSDAITFLQRPIAYLACLNHYKKNDLSHEDDGRKFKVTSDNTEKLPWEWQLDRDNEILMDNYYRCIEVLIRYLNRHEVKEWISSDKYKQAQSLIIRNGIELDSYFPIDRSNRMYFILLPYIREAQYRYVAPCYGDNFSTEIISQDENLHYAACMATALIAMSIAFRRGPLQLIPHSIIKGYLAQNGSSRSDAATLDEVRMVAHSLELDGKDWIEQMKIIRDGGKEEIELLHKNDRKNKFFVL